MIAPERLNIADYFLDQRVAEGLGDKIALITDEGEFSYAQVQQRANQAANCFREAGLESEQRILLSLPDGIDYVAALFGALKVGAAVVMVNPALSQEAMAEMLDYSRARLAVSREELPPSPYLRAQLKNLQHPNSSFENFSTHRDDVAIWLFSGGTTGRPKAVLQSHGSFWNTCELYAKRFLNYRPEDRTLSVPKLFFGYATGSNLFFPFSVGASAILFEGKCTAGAIFDQIERHRPTLLVSVPTMVSHMLEQPERDLSCLRLVTSAGEALPEALYWKWRETFGVELLDGLGTAEMWHIFLSNRPGEVKPGSLGRVVPGFEIKVCDDQGLEVAAGEIGRLWVAGGSRAHGYWQLGEASQEAFRGRYFASSDLVRQDEQGYLSYCGRGDELLKVAGRWVAPQEVESCLLSHPAVAQCSVVGGEDREGLIKPVAFVQLRSGCSEQDLKTYSLEHLEAFKHPRRVVVLENFPQTHLGKVDRGALRRLAVEVLAKGAELPG